MELREVRVVVCGVEVINRVGDVGSVVYLWEERWGWDGVDRWWGEEE